jgi:hypothetical protein
MERSVQLRSLIFLPSPNLLLCQLLGSGVRRVNCHQFQKSSCVRQVLQIRIPKVE